MPTKKSDVQERLDGLKDAYEALDISGVGVNCPTHTAWAKYAVASCIARFTTEDKQGDYQDWVAKRATSLYEAQQLSNEE
jgi:hypothetical protein